jgi:hypothetical protein
MEEIRKIKGKERVMIDTRFDFRQSLGLLPFNNETNEI